MTKTTIASCAFLLLVLFSLDVYAQDTIDYLINWEPNPEPDITGYVLYRSLDRETGFEAIDSVGNNVFEYIDAGLEKGTRYYYRLIAKNTSGERSSFSNPVSGMAIPDNAAESLQDSCKITTITQSKGTYSINWETPDLSTGYIQYDSDVTLDSMSNWDTENYATIHTAQLQNLNNDTKYYAKAVAYDEFDNLTISAKDTFTTNIENPAPCSAPLISIYPVPYHPLQGSMLMKGLPSNGSVRIFNSNGIEIHKETVPATGAINWNGTNHSGSKVMSGVYYVIVEDSSGEVTSKKPIMIVN